MSVPVRHAGMVAHAPMQWIHTRVLVSLATRARNVKRVSVALHCFWVLGHKIHQGSKYLLSQSLVSVKRVVKSFLAITVVTLLGENVKNISQMRFCNFFTGA